MVREGEVDPRIVEAAERTLLAWIRTGLAMMGFGFVIARFSLILEDMASSGQHAAIRSPGLSLWIGTGTVAFGVVVNLYASQAYAREIHRLKSGTPLVLNEWGAGRTLSITTAGLGLLMAAYLVYLKL